MSAATYRILGPIEVWHHEQRLAIGGPRQLRLLAYLLLHANRAVSSDALIDALWGTPVPGHDNRLQMSVARLRRSLAQLAPPDSSVLRTVAGGYLLDVPPGALDSDLLEQALTAGRQAFESGQIEDSVQLVNDGLTLWRGPPLADVAFETFSQAEIRRLEDLRLAATELRVEGDLELGRHAA